MRKLVTKLAVVVMSVAFAGLAGCIPYSLLDVDNETERPKTTQAPQENREESKENKEKEQETSLITEYLWQASGDSSLIVCKTDGSFKYYQSAEDLTNYYYEGTYEFYMGKKAITYITTELSEYAVTKDELEALIDRSEEYEESNFVVLVLNNEACMIDGENVAETPYRTPYYGFCLEENGEPNLGLVNMNSGNYAIYVGK